MKIHTSPRLAVASTDAGGFEVDGRLLYSIRF